MKTVNIFFTAAFFSSAVYWSYAQETKVLSLDEALRLGLENSKNIKIDHAKIEEATANLLAAKNNQLPNLAVSGTYLRIPFEADVKLKTTALPSAGGGSGVKVSQALYGSANLSLPIYAGGRIKYGIKSAEYLLEASKLNAENDKNAIAYNIAQAYNNLFKSAQVVRLLKETLVASQKRDQSFIKLENNGVIARNDRLKAQLQTSNIELQLIEAENNHNIAIINMNLLLGLPENTKLEVDGSYIEQEDLGKTDEYYLNLAKQNRKDIQALELQRKAAELGTKAAKAEELPTIAVTAGYVAAEVPHFLTITNAVNVGLGVQYNLDHLWKKNSNVEKSKAQEKQLAATNELLNDNVTLEVKRDYQNDLYAYKKIEVYGRALEQAEENYRITSNKFNNGLETITNLLEADTAKISAQVNLLNAKADAALAHKKLLQTTGIINN